MYLPIVYARSPESETTDCPFQRKILLRQQAVNFFLIYKRKIAIVIEPGVVGDEFDDCFGHFRRRPALSDLLIKRGLREE